MRSPSKSASRRVRDAESELNLPPGFRFHPTDEELIVNYLCYKSAASHCQATVEIVSVAPPPPPIIADVDLYKHDPWELPELALFGTKEWYFFTPRDRKYPNGSRPNRVTQNGYWKATGADKPIRPKSDPNKTVGIKKALVFYAGKGPKGIKTNWIMHEYRLAAPNPCPSKYPTNAITSKLDDWVLCRLYNKKNNPEEKVIPKDHLRHGRSNRLSPSEEIHIGNNSGNTGDSLDSFEESDVEFDGNFTVNDTSDKNDDNDDVMFLSNYPIQPLTKVKGKSDQCKSSMKMENFMQKDGDDDGNEWLDNLTLEDLQHCLEALPSDPTLDFYQMPMIYHSNQNHFFF